jgi:hypothetical protein
MKTLLQTLLALCFPCCIYAQLYGLNDVGICVQKIQVLGNGTTTGEKQETVRLIRPTIGIKFGYELYPFVIELAGKLNLELTGFTALYAGAKLYLDKENELSFTPLAGLSNHLNFTAAGRLQWQHYCIEFTGFKKITYCTVGFKAYLRE